VDWRAVEEGGYRQESAALLPRWRLHNSTLQRSTGALSVLEGAVGELWREHLCRLSGILYATRALIQVRADDSSTGARKTIPHAFAPGCVGAEPSSCSRLLSLQGAPLKLQLVSVLTIIRSQSEAIRQAVTWRLRSFRIFSTRTPRCQRSSHYLPPSPPPC
jgi:hypothetical protein